MIKIIINGISYANCFLRVEWSGSIKNSARKLDISFLKGKIKVDLGDKVEFYHNNNLLMIGTIFRYDTTTSNTEETITVFDNGIRLNKNYHVKNFFQQTPSEITKNVLSEVGLEFGKLPTDETKCDFPAWNRSTYEIMLMAYKIQNSKNNKVYSIVDNLGKIEVIEQGTLIQGVTLLTSTNILNASYSKSIEEMINKVVLYEMKEDSPNIIGNKTNEEDIKKYGIFQQVQEQDKSNSAYLQVQNVLKGVEETASIECLGNTELESGYSVPIKVSNISRINGIFLIESDTHTWDGVSYICNLELTFENVMNDIEVETYPNKKQKKGAKVEEKIKPLKPEEVGDN